MNLPALTASDLPDEAGPALTVLKRLVEHGHQALLAGGCVRDLLRGATPSDYDVATAATPDQVCALFHATRKVGAQFGVVLVRAHGTWVEVATFRRDADYEDGRRPTHVTYADAQEDARRRDFTINGMFLDPLQGQVIDYVGGQEDLAQRQLRAIGTPDERFAEDHLRLLRAIRFAARLECRLEDETAEAIRTHAPRLAAIAAERRRDELEKILAHPSRADAFGLLATLGLLPALWGDDNWSTQRIDRCAAQLQRLPDDARFETGLAILLGDMPPPGPQQVCRRLTCSNQQRDVVVWLLAHEADVSREPPLSLADTKRLAVADGFDQLGAFAVARDPARTAAATRFLERVAQIDPAQLAPSPFVRGGDLGQRGVPPGPAYRTLLEELYTRQLEEEFADRDAALAALDRLLAAS